MGTITIPSTAVGVVGEYKIRQASSSGASGGGGGGGGKMIARGKLAIYCCYCCYSCGCYISSAVVQPRYYACFAANASGEPGNGCSSPPSRDPLESGALTSLAAQDTISVTAGSGGAAASGGSGGPGGCKAVREGCFTYRECTAYVSEGWDVTRVCTYYCARYSARGGAGSVNAGSSTSICVEGSSPWSCTRPAATANVYSCYPDKPSIIRSSVNGLCWWYTTTGDPDDDCLCYTNHLASGNVSLKGRAYGGRSGAGGAGQTNGENICAPDTAWCYEYNTNPPLQSKCCLIANRRASSAAGGGESGQASGNCWDCTVYGGLSGSASAAGTDGYACVCVTYWLKGE